MSGFQVMSRKCDQCLLGPNRIVSSNRAAEILKQCARDDTHFLCHKGTMAGRQIGCRGHYDTAPGRVPRFAQWLDLVTEIDPDTLAPVDRSREAGETEGLDTKCKSAVGSEADEAPNPNQSEGNHP